MRLSQLMNQWIASTYVQVRLVDKLEIQARQLMFQLCFFFFSINFYGSIVVLIQLLCQLPVDFSTDMRFLL